MPFPISWLLVNVLFLRTSLFLLFNCFLSARLMCVCVWEGGVVKCYVCLSCNVMLCFLRTPTSQGSILQIHSNMTVGGRGLGVGGSLPRVSSSKISTTNTGFIYNKHLLLSGGYIWHQCPFDSLQAHTHWLQVKNSLDLTSCPLTVSQYSREFKKYNLDFQ